MNRRSSGWPSCVALGAALCALAWCGPARAEGELPPPAVPPAPRIIDPATVTQADVDAMLDRLDDLFRSRGSVGEVELTVVKPRTTRSLRMKMWTAGEDKVLIVIESPAREKGTATLKVEKNLWNYLPRTSRTIRIPPSMMLGSWMGSDFTNDDLVRESSLRQDFVSRFAGASQDPPGWRIELKAREGVVGLWEKIEYVVSPDGALPVEARSFDRRGRLSRIMRFDEVKDFGARRIPSRMRLTPIDKDGNPEKRQYTEMKYLEIAFDIEVPESTFSLSRLEQNR